MSCFTPTCGFKTEKRLLKHVTFTKPKSNLAGCAVMGLGRGSWFFALPTSDSPGGRGEGRGIPKRRPESMGSGRLTLTSGNLAVHKSLKPHPPTPIISFMGIGRHEFTDPCTEELTSTSAGIKMALPQTWFHLVSSRNILKSLLVRSPAPERQVGRGCFGQCSGKEGTGLNRVAVEHILERALSGACGKKEERKENFLGWVFCSLSQQNVTGAHLGCIFSKAEHVRKAGAC